MQANYLIAFALLLAYFALHSLLAADGVKAWLRARTGSFFRFYRLIYNVLAAVLLFYLLRWMWGWQAPRLFEGSPLSIGMAFALLLPGVGIVAGALLQYDLAAFIGFQPFMNSRATAPKSGLNTTGFNAWVRHPLYLGTLLILLGVFLYFRSIPTLLLLAAVSIYLPIGIHLEEKKLRQEFGQAYQDYEKRVKRLLPKIW